MTTTERIEEILKTIKNYVGKVDTLTEEILIREMEALVIQAKIEQLQK